MIALSPAAAAAGAPTATAALGAAAAAPGVVAQCGGTAAVLALPAAAGVVAPTAVAVACNSRAAKSTGIRRPKRRLDNQQVVEGLKTRERERERERLSITSPLFFLS